MDPNVMKAILAMDSCCRGKCIREFSTMDLIRLLEGDC